MEGIGCWVGVVDDWGPTNVISNKKNNRMIPTDTTSWRSENLSPFIRIV